MNHLLKTYAKNWLNEHLSLLPTANVEIFHKMYGRQNGKRSLEDTLAMPTTQVIEEMTDEQLDWSMCQVERTITDLSLRQDQMGERGIFFKNPGMNGSFIPIKMMEMDYTIPLCIRQSTRLINSIR